jgi:hypothetical protein
MPMRRHWSFALAFALGAAAASGCSDATGPSADTRAAAGIYVLQPSGQPYEAESGTLYLTPSGKAERHVTFRVDGQPAQEDVSTGTFRVDGSQLTLVLRVAGTDVPFAWAIVGMLDGPTLTFRFPGPADGLITETYRR